MYSHLLSLSFGFTTWYTQMFQLEKLEMDTLERSRKEEEKGFLKKEKRDSSTGWIYEE